MAREQRLVFGEIADTYQKARPSYPPALFDTIVELAGLATGDPVLEIGAGTGKATESLLERGFAVTAVEPSAEMAAVLRGRFADLAIQNCGFEDCAVEPGSFALVAAAQSWHWVDPVRGAHTAADALRPHGWLTLFWNRADLDGCEWHDELQPIYERLAEPLTHANIRATMANTSKENRQRMLATERFGEPVVGQVRWEQRYTVPEYVELLGTQSNHRLLPDAQRAELYAAISAALDAHGGVIQHPYVTDLIAAPVR